MPDDEDDQEVEEINEDTIKQLAAQAAGGGGDEEEEEEEEDSGAAAAAASGEGGGAVEMQVERMRSTIDMLKEQNNSMSDRFQTMSQNIGEIRQMVHGQESDVTELETDVGTLKDTVEDLEPRKITRRLDDLESSIEANQATLQKVQDRLDRVEQRASDVQDTLNDLGSMDNLIELNHEFEEKLSEIREAQRYIERLASKSEKINIRINKKMSEYQQYKARVDALQEKSSDAFKKLDGLEIEMEDAVTEDQLETMRERIYELEEQLQEYESIAPLATMALPEPIERLRQERMDIEEFLAELEERHDSGEMSTEEYERIRDANEEKLEKIEQALVDEWQRVEQAASDLPAEGEAGGEGGGGAPAGGGEAASGAGEDAEEDVDDAGDEAADEAGGEDEEDRYASILSGSIDEVKEAAESQNLDIEELVAREREGENRETLVSWLEGKLED